MFQVAGVNKPLASLAKLIHDGWKIVFDSELSYLQHKRSGKVIKLRKERGVFVVDAYLVQDPKTDAEARKFIGSLGKCSAKNESVFTRQGS